MEKLLLENITISEYSKLLRSGNKGEKVREIESELSKSLGEMGGGMDLALFMMSKDLLIFQCKLAIAIFEFDEQQTKFFERKIKELRAEIEKKTKKKEAVNPYKSFLSWILAVEKYLGFSIDKNNDLLYLSEATKQMLGHYEQQKRQYEEQQAKNRR